MGNIRARPKDTTLVRCMLNLIGWQSSNVRRLFLLDNPSLQPYTDWQEHWSLYINWTAFETVQVTSGGFLFSLIPYTFRLGWCSVLIWTGLAHILRKVSVNLSVASSCQDARIRIASPESFQGIVVVLHYSTASARQMGLRWCVWKPIQGLLRLLSPTITSWADDIVVGEIQCYPESLG